MIDSNGHPLVPLPIPVPDVNGNKPEEQQTALTLIEDAVAEAEQQSTTTIQLWRYSVGKDAIGQGILFALIGFGLYVTLHSTYDFVNTYVGELYGGFGALPVAILTDVSVLCWIYMATQHANNLARLGIAIGMVFVAMVAVAGILFGEIVARAWLESNVVFFSFLLTISLYGSVLAATIYKIASLTTYARIRHIFNFGIAPDINIDELRKLDANTAQSSLVVGAAQRKVEAVKNLLKSGKLDDTIIDLRTKNKTIGEILSELGLPEKNKRDVDRRIAFLKKQKRLS